MENNHHELVYKRIVLKLSGEALAGPQGFGIDPDQAELIANKVRKIHQTGVEIAIIIGAGNLWRGMNGVSRGMDQTTADHMGMIATVMNALALRDALERMDVVARVQTAVPMNSVAEPYIRLRAIRHLEKGRVVIIAGGMGNPYFTTDTPAALRALEIKADIVIKATKVNGVYSADPKKDKKAVRYDRLSYDDVLRQGLQVMDVAAIALARDNRIPVIVFSIKQPGAFVDILKGKGRATVVADG